MERIIARCGIICSECPGYIATQANDRAALERVAKEWSELFHAPITAEYCLCDGCLTTTGRMGGHLAECDIRACAIEHGVLNCAYCDDYGCVKITKFLDEVPEARKVLEEIRAGLGR